MDKIEKEEERKKKILGDALTSDAWATPSDTSVAYGDAIAAKKKV